MHWPLDLAALILGSYSKATVAKIQNDICDKKIGVNW
jgi:hypothetical protein